MAKLKHIHVLSRAGQPDILLGFATRDGNTDVLYKWSTIGWTHLLDLPGTDLKYDSTTWRERVYWVDGKNAIGIYDGKGFCTPVSTAPIGQYIRTYQDRLVVGGDARTQAEIEAALLKWPADSNRNRIIYCEVEDDATWSPNNFIDAATNNGEIISGLEIGATTTGDEGAQSVLVVFKPSVTMLHRGTLGGVDVTLTVLSEEHGAPSHHSHGISNKGVLFVSKTNVCRLEPTANSEPEEIGFNIQPDILNIPLATQEFVAGFYYLGKYHCAIPSLFNNLNTFEFELDTRQPVFPQEQNWYGPHLGDEILQWAVFNDQLIAAQQESLNIWEIDQEFIFRSMVSESPRVIEIILPRLATQNFDDEKLDAIGFRGQLNELQTLTFEFDYERGQFFSSNSWQSQTGLGIFGAIFPLIRMLKQPRKDVQAKIIYDGNSDLQIDSLYLRARINRRQAEKKSGSVQG
jgi:hypothetical protein